MFRSTCRILSLTIAPAVCGLVGCSTLVLPVRSNTETEETVSQPVTLRGRSFSYSLGSAGRVSVSPGETTAQSTSYQLFSDAPVDRPRTAMMTLPLENIIVEPVEATARATPLNGEANLRFLVAPSGSAAMCGEGTLLATFDVTFATGVAAVADETYELSRDAIEILRTNDVMVCLEATANFDANLTVSSFELSFVNSVNTATLTLQNDSAADVYLLAPNEVFSPSTLLAPGGSRVIVVENPTVGYEIVVQAGRSFAIVDTATCPAIEGTEYTADVLWTGEELTCGAQQEIPEEPEPITSETRFQVTLENVGGMATAAESTETYSGVDHAIVGIISAASQNAPAPTNPSSMNVSLETLGIGTVETIHFGLASTYVADLPNGVTVATLTLDFTSGLPKKVPLVLGENTAEWSYDRLEHDSSLGGVRHDQVGVLYSFETSVGSAEDYDGFVYELTVTLDEPRKLSAISLTMAEVDTLGSRPDADEPSSIAQDVLSVTLVGAPDGEDLNEDGVVDEINVIEGVNDDGMGGDGGFEAPEPEPEPMIFGDIMGTVVDAQTGDLLPGATVVVDGTELSATTNGVGEFLLVDVPIGDPAISASLTGYITNTQPVNVLEEETTELSIGLLQFGVGGENVAAVLSWGQEPSDLDLHMSGPNEVGGRFHLYYANRTPVQYAGLDLDDTASFGPETITIVPGADGNFVAGNYHVWIDNFSGTPQYDVSSAKLTLFAAGAQVAQYSVDNAEGNPIFDIWRVIEFTIDASGAITDLGVLQTIEAGGATSEF